MWASWPSFGRIRPPDPTFTDPRLAALYDEREGERADLDPYVAIAEEVVAQRVIDIGCGTGCLAVRLAARGLDVVGVDPAGASLDVARARPHAERVTWVSGDATALLGLDITADLAVMTGNVAQVFVADADWSHTLAAAHACLRPGGWLVFETRRPEVRDWEQWDRAPTTVVLPSGATMVASTTVTDVAPPFVSFEAETIVGGEVLRSTSTLRFRDRREVENDLVEHGFEVVDVRDAPDRPGKELVFVARRAGRATDAIAPR